MFYYFHLFPTLFKQYTQTKSLLGHICAKRRRTL